MSSRTRQAPFHGSAPAGFRILAIPDSFRVELTTAVNVRSRDRHGRRCDPSVEVHSLETLSERLAPRLPPVLHGERRRAQRRAEALERAARAYAAGEAPDPRDARCWELRSLERRLEAGASHATLGADDIATAWIRAHRWFRVLKMDLPVFSPTRFEGGIGSAHAVSTGCVVFDYDDGTRIEEVAAAFAGRVVALIHTTLSHKPCDPRFRLILPLAEPVPASRVNAVLRALARVLPGEPDKGSMDAPHRFVLPIRLYADGSYDARRLGDAGAGLLSVDPPLLRRLDSPPSRSPAPDLSAGAAGEAPDRVTLGLLRGGHLSADGRWVRAVTCPACGRPSVYFSTDPGSGPLGFCHHRHSCGWRGPIRRL